MSFVLDGLRLERRLVTWPVRDMGLEFNVGSPVGKVLLLAEVGDELTVEAPGGELVLKVLKVGDNGRMSVVREGSGPGSAGTLVGAAGPGERKTV